MVVKEETQLEMAAQEWHTSTIQVRHKFTFVMFHN